MRAEDLLDAFQYLDDDMIESVDLIRRNPAQRRSHWPKLLATAACLCLIWTGMRYVLPMYNGFGSGTDGAIAEDMAESPAGSPHEPQDGAEGSLNQTLLTLPDYTLLMRGTMESESVIQYPEDKKTTSDKDSSTQLVDDSLICTADVLPVYCNLNIPTSIFPVEDLGSFEKYLTSLTTYDIYAQFTSIDMKEAVTLLEDGHYLTFEKAGDPLDIDYGSELIYLYDKESDLAIPYYRFYNKEDANISESFKGYFVPAISKDYITNMPSQN